MGKIKSSQIVGITISLLLIGILLPIGLSDLLSSDLSQKTDTTNYLNQSLDNYSQRNFTVFEDQELKATLTFNHSIHHLNLTFISPTNTNILTSSTANQTLELEWNATAYGTYGIRIQNLTTTFALIPYNLTVVITTFMDNETIETLIQQVIPIIAIIGMVIAFIGWSKRKEF